MRRTILSGRRTVTILRRALRWHLAYLRGERPQPVAVGLFATSRCNLRCRMCGIWRDPSPRTLSYESLVKLVDAVADGCCYFSFSGGEPLLVRDIERMVAYASARTPYVHLVSNGLLLTPEKCRNLARAGLDEISLSLDGGEAWHDRVRGEEGSHRAVLEAAAVLREHSPGVRVVLNTVLFPGAVDQARIAVVTARRLGMLIKIQPVNRHYEFPGAAGVPDRLDFSRNDKRELRAFVDECVRDRRVVNSRYYLRKIPEYFAGRLECPPIHPRCRLPYFFLEANPHGAVSPCMFATGWESPVTIDDLATEPGRRRWHNLQDRLTACRLCEQTMFICYWEPLIQFPLDSFLKLGLRG